MAKILIVEDEGIIIDLLKKKLEKEGYDVEIAKDGEEGLRKIKEIWPDLILLDIEMPKISGLGLMEEINKNPSLKRIPIIVMSEAGEPFELKRARELGARDFIIKIEADLPQIINKIIQQIGR
jgi:CheY-like chemotaxis protein